MSPSGPRPPSELVVAHLDSHCPALATCHGPHHLGVSIQGRKAKGNHTEESRSTPSATKLRTKRKGPRRAAHVGTQTTPHPHGHRRHPEPMFSGQSTEAAQKQGVSCGCSLGSRLSGWSGTRRPPWAPGVWSPRASRRPTAPGGSNCPPSSPSCEGEKPAGEGAPSALGERAGLGRLQKHSNSLSAVRGRTENGGQGSLCQSPLHTSGRGRKVSFKHGVFGKGRREHWDPGTILRTTTSKAFELGLLSYEEIQLGNQSGFSGAYRLHK